jgi:hypothetical protein
VAAQSYTHQQKAGANRARHVKELAQANYAENTFILKASGASPPLLSSSSEVGSGVGVTLKLTG